MKKTVALILALALFAGPAMAQTEEIEEVVPKLPRNEFSLSYGRVSIPAFAMTFGMVLGTVFTGGLAAPDDIGSTGAIGFEYFHWCGPKHGEIPRFAFGCTTVFEDFHYSFKTVSGKDADGNRIYEPGDPVNCAFVTVMPAVKWRYVVKPHFSMYAKGAAGILADFQSSYTSAEKDESGEETNVTHSATTTFNFACQVSLLGIEFGGDSRGALAPVTYDKNGNPSKTHTGCLRGFAEVGLGMQGLLIGGIKYAF